MAVSMMESGEESVCGKEDEQRGRDDGTRTVEPWRGGIYPRKAESGIPRA